MIEVTDFQICHTLLHAALLNVSNTIINWHFYGRICELCTDPLAKLLTTGTLYVFQQSQCFEVWIADKVCNLLLAFYFLIQIHSGLLISFSMPREFQDIIKYS